MNSRIKVAAVSYLNTKPLLYGIEKSVVIKDIDLILDYPSGLAKKLQDGIIDLALLPVAAIPHIKGANIISNYGIASNGNVVSVALFSDVPLEDIKKVYLDYQSRTSVKLAQILLENYWKIKVEFLPAHENYIEDINVTTAGVIIGDRALKNLNRFKYNYDLSAAWKNHTGLDFVFAAWVANKKLPTQFVDMFNAANENGLQHLDIVIALNPCNYYDLNTYYSKNIQFLLDDTKKQGLELFLKKL